MGRHSEQAHHFKRVELPSGKTIEVLYFGESGETKPSAPAPESAIATGTDPTATDAPPQQHTQDSSSAAPAEALHVCIECAGELVYPDDWEEAGHHAWRVTLVCPSCGHERRDVFPDDSVEALDEELDRGTDALARDYKALMRANMADEVERFVGALDAGAIQPMDF